MSLWIYLIAPLLGMLLAAEVYVRIAGKRRVKCAKLHHQNDKRCIFRCGYASEESEEGISAQASPTGRAAAAGSPSSTAGNALGVV